MIKYIKYILPCIVIRIVASCFNSNDNTNNKEDTNNNKKQHVYNFKYSTAERVILLRFKNCDYLDTFVNVSVGRIQVKITSSGDYFTNNYRTSMKIIMNDKNLLHDSGIVSVKFNDLFIRITDKYEPIVYTRYIKTNFGNGDTLKFQMASVEYSCNQSVFIPTPVGTSEFKKSIYKCSGVVKYDSLWSAANRIIDSEINLFIDSIRKERHY